MSETSKGHEDFVSFGAPLLERISNFSHRPARKREVREVYRSSLQVHLLFRPTSSYDYATNNGRGTSQLESYLLVVSIVWEVARGFALFGLGGSSIIVVSHCEFASYSLGLGKNTTASIQAFKKRSEDARRHLTALKAEKTDVDLSYYKSTLKNQSVVSQAEKILKDFKPVTYDVASQLKAIDAFEAKAVSRTTLCLPMSLSVLI
jgi:hypothetical protein